jgi:hypothetical protein
VRNAEQSDRDGIHDGCIERYARHVQTRTFTVAGFAAVVLAIGMMTDRVGAACVLGTGSIRCHLSRRMLHWRRRAGHRHGMTQLADDQTGHQQEN